MHCSIHGTAAAAALATSALAGNAFNSVSLASWQADGNAIYSPDPAFYFDSLAGISQSGTSVVGGTGWGAFTAQGLHGTTVNADTVPPNSIVAFNSTGATTLRFTFPNGSGTSATTGLFGLGFNFSVSGSASMNITATSTQTGSFMFNVGSSGFIGVWNNSSRALQSVTFTLQQGATLTITGITYGMVPAPGAVALLGLAGMVGSRRRRS